MIKMDPIWKWIPPSFAHALAPLGLDLYCSFLKDRGEERENTSEGGPDEMNVPSLSSRQNSNSFSEGVNFDWNNAKMGATWGRKPLIWKGIRFPHRLGIAAGVDKNAHLLQYWPQLGGGFVEVGTVTPRPQSPNPGRILQRDWSHKNLWNKMGFPSEGAEEVFFNIATERFSQIQPYPIPILVNIGKNRDTPNERAWEDYEILAEKMKSVADILVINVSSPNTKGLRDLQMKEELRKIVDSVVQKASSVPVLVKLSPDLSDSELEETLNAALTGGAKGFVLTNTTRFRPLHCPFPDEGGLSGQDLKKGSIDILIKANGILGDQRKGLLMISVGGVFSNQDLEERIRLGADLVQLYSAMIFHGPGVLSRVRG